MPSQKQEERNQNVARPNLKHEEIKQSVARPNPKQEVSPSVAWPRTSIKNDKNKKTCPSREEEGWSLTKSQLEEKQEERPQSVAKPSQSCRREKNTASLNSKTESKRARNPQKKTSSLTKQILAKTPRKNVSRGKNCRPFKVKSEKIKRVADIRVYFEAKNSGSPSFKGGGGTNKQAENQISKTKLNHSNLDPAKLTPPEPITSRTIFGENYPHHLVTQHTRALHTHTQGRLPPTSELPRGSTQTSYSLTVGQQTL